MPVDEPLYPVNLRVAGRHCLVVGGGRVAADKVAGLLECEALVHVVAPELGDLLAEMVAAEVAAPEGGDRLTWDQRPYRAGDLDGGAGRRDWDDSGARLRCANERIRRFAWHG